MSNWCGGLPPEPQKEEDKRIKKGGKPSNPPHHGGRPKVFFGGAVPASPPKDLPKMTAADLKGPPVIFKVAPATNKPAESSNPGGNPPSPKAPPSSPKAPAASSAPSPPPPPPPSSSTPAECDPSSQYSSSSSPSLPLMPLPSVFDKKEKKKKKKKKKKPPPPPPKQPSPCYDACEEEAEEKIGEGATLPSIFAISHIPAIRQYEEDDYYQEKEDRSGHASPRSGEEDDGPDIPPSVPHYLRGNVFAGIFGKQIDARNITQVGLHGWHATSNAPYDVTDAGDTVTVGPSGWHEARESPW